MTTAQAKSQGRKLATRLLDLCDTLNALIDDVADFNDEVEETRDSIEPYGDRDELTQQQADRYEWLDELHYILDEIINLDVEDAIIALNEYLEY